MNHHTTTPPSPSSPPPPSSRLLRRLSVGCAASSSGQRVCRGDTRRGEVLHSVELLGKWCIHAPQIKAAVSTFVQHCYVFAQVARTAWLKPQRRERRSRSSCKHALHAAYICAVSMHLACIIIFCALPCLFSYCSVHSREPVFVCFVPPLSDCCVVSTLHTRMSRAIAVALWLACFTFCFIADLSSF
jgi:hypothetical protein